MARGPREATNLQRIGTAGFVPRIQTPFLQRVCTPLPAASLQARATIVGAAAAAARVSPLHCAK